MTENELAKIVFELGTKVHKKMGPGLLEGVYEECLFYELRKANIDVEQQKEIKIIYDGVELEKTFKPDLILENKLIVEVKSVVEFHPIHLAQTLTYLKLSECKLALLINFNVALFKQGVRRVIEGNLAS